MPPTSGELIGEDLRPHVALLGEISEADKGAFLRSVDVYCAPNLLGESFGVVLIEALAAGAPIVASDLDAFARVLEDGAAGVLVPRGDAAALGQALADLLADPGRRAELSVRGAGSPRPTTGRCWPAASWPSTRPSCRPMAAWSPPARTTSSRPSGRATRSTLRRWVQR